MSTDDFDVRFDETEDEDVGADAPGRTVAVGSAEAPVLRGEVLPFNPAEFGWPPTLALELALKVAPIRDICESYGISREEWEELRGNATFISEVTGAAEALRKEGAAFRARAHLQSLELLKSSWKMIHDPTVPHNVRADLIKFTVRVAGLDASKDQGFGKLGGGGGGGFAIHINLGLGIGG